MCVCVRRKEKLGPTTAAAATTTTQLQTHTLLSLFRIWRLRKGRTGASHICRQFLPMLSAKSRTRSLYKFSCGLEESPSVCRRTKLHFSQKYPPPVVCDSYNLDFTVPKTLLLIGLHTKSGVKYCHSKNRTSQAFKNLAIGDPSYEPGAHCLEPNNILTGNKPSVQGRDRRRRRRCGFLWRMQRRELACECALAEI